MSTAPSRSGLAGAAHPAPSCVLDCAPDPILVVDGEGLLIWGNPAAERFFGVELDEAVGTPGLELVHPDDLEFALLSMITVQDKVVGSPIEVRLRAHDGWRLVEIIGSPVPQSPRGEVVLSLRDLTDRRRFEVAADDDAMFRSLVHNSTTLTMLVATTGELIAASGALPRLLGIDPGVAAGRPLVALVDPDDHGAVAAALRVAATRPSGAAGAVSVEARLLRNDGGTPVPFALTIVNLVEDPTVGGLVVSGHDIAARRAAEDAAHHALSLLGATLNSTNDGILVVDREGAITTVNARFAELWRIPDELLAARDDAAALDYVVGQLVDPDAFRAKVAELYSAPEAESHDLLHFRDGRVFERFSRPQWVGGEIVGRVWSFLDITERMQLEAQLAHQALHDSLTGLANQSLFRDRVEHALTRLGRHGGRLAVLFLDLDDFKSVNDSLGHPAGDRLLVEVSRRVEGAIRAADSAARLGGDEFAVLLEDVDDDAEIVDVAERLLRTVRQTVTLDGTEVSTSVSIGVAIAEPATSCDQLLRDADLAMYTAKRRGRGRFELYRHEMHAAAVERLTLETELRRALERDELVVHYQPIIDLGASTVWGVEALARWNHPSRGVLGPDAFLRAAEETGLIDQLSRRVLSEACAQVRTWRAAAPELHELSISVNLSAGLLVDPGLVDLVREALAEHALDSDALILEITEGAMMHDTDEVVANLGRLKELGVRVAVDDFGTGYSSLAYLQRFPIDILKVDKSFVDGLDEAPADAELAQAIIRLARALHLTPIAEGVERAAQADRLEDLGCHLAQGYLFARPAEAAAVTDLLLDRARAAAS
jgi:diguanylate cyclase (GGDEF)-like protein/PAS domain S-box-containing protein